jgi:hypothetical protein
MWELRWRRGGARPLGIVPLRNTPTFFSFFFIREIGWDGKDWVDLAQNKDQWRALVNTVMNFRVP